MAGPTPDLSVVSESGTLRKDTTWASSAMRGWRDDMEDHHVVTMLDESVLDDTAVFAVFDGHGGKDVSALAASLLVSELSEICRQDKGTNSEVSSKGTDSGQFLQTALKNMLPRLDERILRGYMGLGRMLPFFTHPYATCGSTACVVAVSFTRREVFVANLGDSRAILIRNGKAIALSTDHKPEDPAERTRIRAAGGQVLKMGPCYRVDGTLNLSRALGDFHLKANRKLPPEAQKVVAFPDCTQTPFRGGSEELLVVACDGLFEKCSNQDVADIVWPRVRQGMSLTKVGQELLHACCARGFDGRPVEPGTDNETVLLVKLPPARPETKDAAGLATGDRVLVHGLQTETGRQLNGLVGIIEGLNGPSNDRYLVRLVADGVVKSFKAANLKPAEATCE
eukprot:CAMPEP_0117490568 /NCGR_PEP_ID=MMETSP0784-20121206/17617_1 /TAXON_ID=39447 /ORGANISM="" /LENGTH=395 /DNA_ID=CAMNT_0005285329 /DNA_START=258 /DNA_END=1445 /DNA_ORIENTATION=-